MMYTDTADRQDTPYGRIWAAIDDHTTPGNYRNLLRTGLRVVTGDLPATGHTNAVLALNGRLLADSTPTGRRALRDFWGMWNNVRKAA